MKWLCALSAFLLTCTAAETRIYQCTTKEWVRLEDDGILRATNKWPFTENVRRFMVDTDKPNTVGALMSGIKTWRAVQQGSRQNSFIADGLNARGGLFFRLTIYEFKPGQEKPFALSDMDGLTNLYTGTCR